jgi:MipA family protein
MRAAILATLLLLLAWPALAQSVDANADNLTVGIGVTYEPSYEGSDAYNLQPGGFITGEVSGIAFFSRGPRLFVDVLRKPRTGLDFQLGPVAGVRLNRAIRIADSQVESLGELDAAIELGGFVGIARTGVITSDYDSLSLRVSFVHDVANVHKSFVITPSIEYLTPLSTATVVGASIFANIVGAEYGQTYFGVSEPGAIVSGLAPFRGEGGLKDIAAGVFARQSLGRDLRRGFSVFGSATYSRLLGPFKRSPIVADAGSADQWFLGAGVSYSF